MPDFRAFCLKRSAFAFLSPRIPIIQITDKEKRIKQKPAVPLIGTAGLPIQKTIH